MIGNISVVLTTLAALAMFGIFLVAIVKSFHSVVGMVADVIAQIKAMFSAGNYKEGILSLAAVAVVVAGAAYTLKIVYVLFDVETLTTSGEGSINLLREFFRSAGWQ